MNRMTESTDTSVARTNLLTLTFPLNKEASGPTHAHLSDPYAKVGIGLPHVGHKVLERLHHKLARSVLLGKTDS